MPITPHVTLSQTDVHVLIDIGVPHVRVSTESVHVTVTDDSVLHFASPPYLLVLDFAPHEFHETADESCATYLPAISDGTIQLKLRKKRPRVHWDNLDLIGKLVPKRKTTTSRWLKEAIPENGGGLRDFREELMDNDSQEVLDVPERTVTVPLGYGFARMFHGVFTDLARDGLAKEMLELPWQEAGANAVWERDEGTVREARRNKRLLVEQEKFSEERYLQDLDIADDYIYQCAMGMQTHWLAPTDDVDSLPNQMANLTVEPISHGDKSDDSTGVAGRSERCSFSTDEQLLLSSIPYPLLPPYISSEQQDILFLGLLDILYAYAYDHLLTDGDPTVESAWTITILSASLAWLEDWQSAVRDHAWTSVLSRVVATSVRRTLVYPYLRNITFSVHVWKQVAIILRRGVRCVLRCLLQTRTILDKSEMYYLGNKLFLDPYLTWLQSEATFMQERLRDVAVKLDQVVSETRLRELVGLDLASIEIQAFTVDKDDRGFTSDENDDAEGSTSTSSSGGSSSDSSTSIDKSPTTRTLPAVEVTLGPRSTVLLDENLDQHSIFTLTVSHASGTTAESIDNGQDAITGEEGTARSSPELIKPLVQKM
jgi:protein SHQ1